MVPTHIYNTDLSCKHKYALLQYSDIHICIYMSFCRDQGCLRKEGLTWFMVPRIQSMEEKLLQQVQEAAGHIKSTARKQSPQYCAHLAFSFLCSIYRTLA